jgi:hypothetical protein
MKDDFKTDVIFRKWNNKNFAGDHIIALFPHEVCNYDGSVTSYMHFGQHGDATYNHCIRSSKPAKEKEYIDLYRELQSIGYDLNVIKKRNYSKYLTAYREINSKK